MYSRTILIAGLSTLAMCGVAVGSYSAIANAQEETALTRRADQAASDARKALAKGDIDAAIRHAEGAVLAMPGDAEHRVLLGQAYLGAGRFLSAGQAFDDALTIDRGHGRAALNLALAKTALGDWAGARRTLGNFADVIAPGDRGLALALAGDPGGAVQLLSDAARREDATPKVRQNLALALALSDRWQEARAVAAVDLSPAQLDKRLMEWAAFARPQAASDQVASLLGVTAVADGGQPVQLALQGSAPQMAEAAPAPEPANFIDATIEEIAPVAAMAAAVSAPVVPVARSVPVADTSTSHVGNPVFAAARIIFAESREIVQALPAAYRQAEAPVRTAAAPAPRAPVARKAAGMQLASGEFHVQLGAFDSEAVARDGWNRMTRRVAALGTLRPKTAQTEVGGVTYHRLSVGGLDQASARQLCRQVQASGTRCFVRAQAGDRLASWAQGQQLASR